MIKDLHEMNKQLFERAERERMQREAWQAPAPCECGHLDARSVVSEMGQTAQSVDLEREVSLGGN